MLTNITVSIENLILDPNNPRFITDLRSHNDISDIDAIKLHDKILKRFSNATACNDDEATNISVLYDSITTVGYVPIDRVVIRQIADSDKYIVIEGNRRVSTVKTILDDIENRSGRLFSKQDERERVKPLMDSYANISCMLLETAGISEEDISHHISIILGLRHHGSLLEWEALPKAYNIFKEYMCINPAFNEFKLDTKRIKDISTRLSISKPMVTNALKTYVAYLQLCEIYSVDSKHYSLIQAGVINKNLAKMYFNINEANYKLDEPSLEKMNALCQFEIRDNLPANKKKILDKPQSFTKFGKLIDKRRKLSHEAMKQFADDLIYRVLDDDIDENNPGLTIDEALDQLTDLEHRIHWVDTVSELLDKQEKELNLSDYTGTGNQLGNKDTLRKTIEPLLRMMNLQ